MIKIEQNIIHNPDKGDIGNCLQPCIASILELPIEDVPHFAERRQSDWFDRMNDWLRDRGYWVLHINGWSDDFTPYGYSIACGTSRRGIRHSCVALDGKLIHDPHPDQTGLAELDSYYLLVATFEKASKANEG